MREFIDLVEGASFNLKVIQDLLMLAGHPGTSDAEAVRAVRKAYQMLDARKKTFRDLVVDDAKLITSLQLEISRLRDEVALLKEKLRSRQQDTGKRKTWAELVPEF